MLSNKLALTFIGLLAFVGAVGSGAYLASRKAVDVPKASVAAPVNGSPSAAQPVEATEAVMDDKVPPQEPPPATQAVDAPVAPASKSAPPASVANRHAPVQTPARASRPAAPASRTPSPAVRPDVRPAETATADRGASADRSGSRRSLPPADEQPRPATPETTSAREERRTVDPLPPAVPQFEEVTVPTDAVIGLQIENTVSSETARMEDRVEARVSRDVRSEGRVAIPAGSKVLGSVSVVERGGKMRERARLGVRFHTVILADGTELPLQTDTVYREGESPTNSSSAKVGGAAVGGAILGAILGGGKGAAIGGAIGAGAGTGAVMAGSRRPAQIQAGSPMTVKVLSPITVNVEK